jgi:hypothetical protein
MKPYHIKSTKIVSFNFVEEDAKQKKVETLIQQKFYII